MSWIAATKAQRLYGERNVCRVRLEGRMVREEVARDVLRLGGVVPSCAREGELSNCRERRNDERSRM